MTMRDVLLGFDAVSINNEADPSPMRSFPDIDWCFRGATRPEEVTERIEGRGLMVVNKVVLDAATLEEAAVDLRLVVIAATGTNNVNLEAAARLRIAVCNVRDYGTLSVAQHVYALV